MSTPSPPPAAAAAASPPGPSLFQPIKPIRPSAGLPFYRAMWFKNSAVILPIALGSYWAFNRSIQNVDTRDFTKEPHYAEVLREIKREEMRNATQHITAPSTGGFSAPPTKQQYRPVMETAPSQ